MLAEYRARSLPLSIAVLDMNWHTDGWNHYTWETSLFPDPAAFVASVHDGTSGFAQPLKLALNIHPGAYNLTPTNEVRCATRSV